jgi:hypothetical protein
MGGATCEPSLDERDVAVLDVGGRQHLDLFVLHLNDR